MYLNAGTKRVNRRLDMHSANLISGKSFRRLTTALAMTTAAALCAPAAVGMAQESTDPIKLTLHDWTGQLITTNIMGEVLKKAGYSIEYVQADYLAQFAAWKPATCTSPWRCGKPRPRGDGRRDRHRQG
jgi:hypothetical protein